jgi:membrane protease YdiL (CAAX protease family)
VRVAPLFRGHLLLFDRRDGPAYAESVGVRLLVLCVILELVVGPRASLLTLLGIDIPPLLRVPLFLVACIAVARFWVRASFEDLGFLAWRKWTATEKLYLAQVVPLALAIFGVLYSEPLGVVRRHPEVWAAGAAICAVELLWGFYQELVYRGMLQSELTRRWGGTWGLLAANVLFTFGPLHFYHLTSGRPWSSIAAILAATFAIGLFFGFVFLRTRNLWLVGTLHGIGNVFIAGAPAMAELAR